MTKRVIDYGGVLLERVVDNSHTCFSCYFQGNNCINKIISKLIPRCFDKGVQYKYIKVGGSEYMNKKFATTKMVSVTEMSRIEYVHSRGWELPENELNLAEERVYKVEYEDGYISMCPKDIFLKNARPIDELPLGTAIEFCIKGAKIARKGWNGKDMFITYVDSNKDMNPYFIIHNTNATKSTWVASVTI